LSEDVSASVEIDQGRAVGENDAIARKLNDQVGSQDRRLFNLKCHSFSKNAAITRSFQENLPSKNIKVGIRLNARNAQSSNPFAHLSCIVFEAFITK